jgi:tetratricopeptide (TPR) repeat protein
MALGVSALQEARYEDAAPHFGRAAQSNANFSTAYFFHAIALALAGRKEEARPFLHRGLELEPSFSSRLFFEHGLAPALVARLAEGSRLLGLAD